MLINIPCPIHVKFVFPSSSSSLTYYLLGSILFWTNTSCLIHITWNLYSPPHPPPPPPQWPTCTYFALSYWTCGWSISHALCMLSSYSLPHPPHWPTYLALFSIAMWLINIPCPIHMKLVFSPSSSSLTYLLGPIFYWTCGLQHPMFYTRTYVQWSSYSLPPHWPTIPWFWTSHVLCI